MTTDATARPARYADYAVRLDIDYPERLDRLTTAFRIILAIPIFILAATLGDTTFTFARDAGGGGAQAGAVGGGALVVPVVLMILFRQKYPRWWFDWNLEFTRFGTRIGAYVGLLTDRYPSTDEEQTVHLDIDYPDVPRDLNRWLPLVKWLLAIPHFIVLIVLFIAVLVVTLIAWFAILFTGRYPRGLFDFVVGVTRWGLRVQGYALLLVTDRYPPFSPAREGTRLRSRARAGTEAGALR